MESWVYTQGKLKGIEEGKLRGLEEGKLQGLEEGKLRGLEEGKLRGLEEGKVEANLGTLRGLFLRRVGRSPDEAEEASLRRRAAAISPEGLVEVFDLSSSAFLAWLADPR
ncbi:MAG: hypothetical protein R3B70_04185 [Polyangiaceae bacterium]